MTNEIRYFVDQNYRVMDRRVNGIIARCANAQDANTVAFSLNYTSRRAVEFHNELRPVDAAGFPVESETPK